MEQEVTKAPRCNMRKYIPTTGLIALLAISTTYLFTQHNNQKLVIRNQESEISRLKDSIAKQVVTDNNLSHRSSELFNNLQPLFRDTLSGIEDRISGLWGQEFTSQGDSSYYSYTKTRTYENEHVITVALPGLSKEKMTMELSGNKLVITATKAPLSKNTDEAETSKQNGEQGHVFKRTIKVPSNIDPDNIKATLTNGLLTITLPRIHDKTNLEPRKILID